MTVTDLAKKLKINPQTVYRFAREGKVPTFKLGRTIRFESDSIDNWIKTNTRQRTSK